MSKIQLVAQANLPTEYGIFKMVGFEFPDTKKEHIGTHIKVTFISFKA